MTWEEGSEFAILTQTIKADTAIDGLEVETPYASVLPCLHTSTLPTELAEDNTVKYFGAVS